MNPTTGEKTIVIAGVRCTLRFTWRALSEIEAAFGDNPNLSDPKVLARIAEAGLRDHNPDMTAERIIDLSPPLMPFAQDVQQALHWAYFGPGAPSAGTDEVKKKARPGRLLRSIMRLFGRGSPP